MDHLPASIQTIFVAIGDALGLNATFAQFVSLLLVNIIVAALFRWVSVPALRRLVSASIGLLWCYVLYGVPNTLTLVAFSGAMYILTVSRYVSAGSLTILAIAVLSYFHISRMIASYMSWSLDITSPLMLMTAKFSMFAYDLQDGVNAKTKLALSSDQHVAEARSRTCILEIPSFLDYSAYIFDFLGVIAGPVFHIRDYMDFMYLRNEFADQSNMHCFKTAGLRFLSGLCVGALFAASGSVPQLDFEYVYSSEFASSALITKVLLVHFMTSALRLKYYFAWYMAETACLMAGIAYNPSNRDKYSRAQNAILTKVDWANCQAEAMSHWNISISRWLRSCIYLRANEAPLPGAIRGKVGHRQYATILTRFVSAFWHGFYPGYYLAFLSTVLQSEADSVARKFIRPLFTATNATKPHWIYTLVGKIHTAICLNFYGSAFLVLSASATIHIWKSLYFGVHALNLATIILLPIVCKKFFKSSYTRTPPVEKKSQ